MNPLLPIIEELDEAEDDAERAVWLLAAPVSVLLKYEMTIRNRLRSKGFLAGVEYLDCEIAMARAVRKDGVGPVNPLVGAMRVIAGTLPAATTDI